MNEIMFDFVGDLWKSFRPGKIQDESFDKILLKLKSEFGLIGDFVLDSDLYEQNTDFIELFGKTLSTAQPGILGKSIAAINSRSVLYHTLQNVEGPDEVEFKYRGFRLAHKINHSGKDGIELFVFDKGEGFVDHSGKINILKSINQGYSLRGTNRGEGLTEALINSNVYEIESRGQRVEFTRAEEAGHFNYRVAEVPFVKGAKIRAIVYER